MTQNQKIGLGIGGLAVFGLLCFGGYTMGQNNNLTKDDSSESGGSTAVEGLQAQEMRLEQMVGTVNLSNLGEIKIPVAGARLMSQDNLVTQEASNAYVLLDSSKALRVDEISNIEIQQNDKHYDVHLLAGSLYFNVSQSLGAEETLEFHTNNVVTGVRGTSGVITSQDNGKVTQIAILSGVVDCNTGFEIKSISAGQVGLVTTHDDGSVTFEVISTEENDPFLFLQDNFIDLVQLDDPTGQPFTLAEQLRSSNAPFEPMDYVTIEAGYQINSSKVQQGESKVYHIYEVVDPSVPTTTYASVTYYPNTYFEVIAQDENGYYDQVRVTCTDSGAIPYPTVDTLLTEIDYNNDGEMDLELYTGNYGARAYSYPQIYFTQDQGYHYSQALNGQTDFAVGEDGYIHMASRADASGYGLYSYELVDDTLVMRDSYRYDYNMSTGAVSYTYIVYENGAEIERYTSNPSEMTEEEFKALYME